MSIYEVCLCEAPLSLRRTAERLPRQVSVTQPKDTGHEVGREDPEERDDPKTRVSSGAATPARQEPGTEMHSEGRKGTGLQDHGVEVTGA